MANNKKIVTYSVIGSCCIILLLAGLLTVIMVQGAPSTSTVAMQPAAGIDVGGSTVDTTCTNFASWVGQPVDEDAVKATGRIYRILTPSTIPTTMEYSEGRINVLVDEQNIVLQVRCG